MSIPKNRINQRITYSEFQRLRAEGYNGTALGISKHQVSFFYALEKGKLNITKKEFEEAYKNGKSLVEIADWYNIQRDHIGFLRDYLGIKRLGPKYINRKKKEKSLTDRQKRLIYGSLMGDAGRMTNASVKMKQSVEQEDYLRWKFKELKEHVTERGIKIDSSYQKEMKKVYSAYTFYTHANSDIEAIISQFYNPHKIVSQEVLDNLDEFSVAVWFMDDGTTDWGRRHLWKANPATSFCTDSFSKAECELICEWFKERWGICPHIRARDKSQNPHHRVIFSTIETPKLFDLIRPFVIDSMLYKIHGETT